MIETFVDSVGLAKQWGPLVFILVYFVWRDYERERKATTRESEMAHRVVQLEDEQRKVIVPLLEKCATVIGQNTLIMQRLERLVP